MEQVNLIASTPLRVVSMNVYGNSAGEKPKFSTYSRPLSNRAVGIIYTITISAECSAGRYTWTLQIYPL